MESAALIVGIVISLAGIVIRFGTDGTEFFLEAAERHLDEDKFWGYPTDDIEKNIQDIIREQKLTGFKKFKFELVCWSFHIVGGVLLIGSAVLLYNEHPDRTAYGLMFVFFGVGLQYHWRKFYERYSKLETEVALLKQRLKAVKDNSVDMRKASIDDVLEIEKRVAKLEG